MLVVTKMFNCYLVSETSYQCMLLVDFSGEILEDNSNVWGRCRKKVLKAIELYNNGRCPNCGEKIITPKKYAGSCDICVLEDLIKREIERKEIDFERLQNLMNEIKILNNNIKITC